MGQLVQDHGTERLALRGVPLVQRDQAPAEHDVAASRAAEGDPVHPGIEEVDQDGDASGLPDPRGEPLDLCVEGGEAFRVQRADAPLPGPARGAEPVVQGGGHGEHRIRDQDAFAGVVVAPVAGAVPGAPDEGAESPGPLDGRTHAGVGCARLAPVARQEVGVRGVQDGHRGDHGADQQDEGDERSGGQGPAAPPPLAGG